MTERRKLEYFLLRYVPDAVRETFVDIGIVMIEATNDASTFADVRFTQNWDLVRCIDPQADIDVLRALEPEIRRRVVDVRKIGPVLNGLTDSYSNLIQLSGSKGCLTEDPEKEIEMMARLYFGPRGQARSQAATGRQKILEVMNEAWASKGIAKFMRPVPVAKFTKVGDPFKFDFGFTVGNGMRLFHAVSLKANVNAAVTLAARYPKIAEGMRASDEAWQPTLAAVVDDGLQRAESEIGFALGMMQESGIKVRTAAEMTTVAEEARLELRA
ncbi:MAG TPA: DUF3037 domain-containing protein [Candidatus Solibacter sp.]|nr:DUF3037 domain-containing protein [Candidatus Solibacter sp.]